MSKTNIDWVKEQLTNAKVSQPVGNSVMRLMEVWSTMNHSDKTRDTTLEIFSRLAKGHAIIDDQQSSLEGKWIPVQPGQIKVAEIVRVKADAYDGDLGMMHNGRVGRVVAVRYGDVIIKTIDEKDPLLDGAHYSPYMLEKLVQL